MSSGRDSSLARLGESVNLKRQAELGLAFQLLLAERRQGHAEKADAFCDREQWLEQRVAKLLDFGSRRKERLTGQASRDLLEIGIFHFQGHRAPANLCSLASAPDLFDDRLEPLACGLECEDIGGKGVSAPRDLRIRSARTGRSSMPRAIQ